MSSFSNAYRNLSPTKKTVEPLLKDEHKAQRKRKSFEKKNSFFPMKKRSVSITVKMIVHGPLIERKQIGEVEKKNNKESL